MFFATKEKVERKVADFIVQLEKLDVRLQAYESREKVLGGIFGTSSEIADMRGAHDDVYGTLVDALAGLKSGAVKYGEISPQLKPLTGAINHMRAIIDRADADGAKSRATFNARFN